MVLQSKTKYLTYLHFFCEKQIIFHCLPLLSVLNPYKVIVFLLLLVKGSASFLVNFIIFNILVFLFFIVSKLLYGFCLLLYLFLNKQSVLFFSTSVGRFDISTQFLINPLLSFLLLSYFIVLGTNEVYSSLSFFFSFHIHL